MTAAGEEIMRAGDWAGFKAGEPDGHTFQNRSDKDAILIEIGSRVADDAAFYPDIDLMTVAVHEAYAHRDGTVYPVQPRRT